MKAARVLIGSLAIFAGLAIGNGFVDMAFGSTADRYLITPADAGALAKDHEPPVDQQHAWSIGFTSGRVLAYYWDLPPRALDRGALRDEEVADDELVLVNLARLPDWYPDGTTPVAERGRYAIVSTGALRTTLDSSRSDHRSHRFPRVGRTNVRRQAYRFCLHSAIA